MRAVQSQRLLVVLIILAAFPPSARGELVFEVLHRLAGGPGNASSPRSALMEASDGSFYGTTAGGGEFGHGTVFVFDPPGDFRILHSLREVEGREPQAALIEASDGSFYGTAAFGGEFGTGTIFKVDRSGHFTTLHSCNRDPAEDGTLPVAELIEASDGNFYGTTSNEGRGVGIGAGAGTVFKITSSGAFTVLHSFSLLGPHGAHSSAALVEVSNGTFYGTTTGGGASGLGTVFRIDNGGRFSTLVSFRGDDGSLPEGILRSSDGNLYGTTGRGGEADHGTIFRVTPTGSLSTLHSFHGDDGSVPAGVLIEASDGNFYGTTVMGGTTDNGTVFKITPAGVLTTLHSFDGVDGAFRHADGQYPHAGLLEASDGSFYGTTVTGGTGAGIVFRLRPREGGPSFLRGDCNNDGSVEGQVADAVFLLNHNFLGGPGPDCLASCDANGDGSVLGTVTDGVHLLMFNFLGGPPPVDPFPRCGPSDSESDASLGCAVSSCP